MDRNERQLSSIDGSWERYRKTKAFLEYKGVEVKKSTCTETNYFFADLEVGNSTKPGINTISFKENEKDTTLNIHKYELKARAKESAKR